MFFNDIHIRIKIILISIVILFFLIVFKVFYIQVIDYNKLNNLAKDLWSRNLPLEANRGNIYDINGNLLASYSSKLAKGLSFITLIFKGVIFSKLSKPCLCNNFLLN